MITLDKKYKHEKLNDDELYREVIIYKVDNKDTKIASMMAILGNNGRSWCYNMDCDTYYNRELDDCVEDIPKNILKQLEDLACRQVILDYRKK